jgi:hypothetical protein
MSLLALDPSKNPPKRMPCPLAPSRTPFDSMLFFPHQTPLSTNPSSINASMCTSTHPYIHHARERIMSIQTPISQSPFHKVNVHPTNFNNPSNKYRHQNNTSIHTLHPAKRPSSPVQCAALPFSFSSNKILHPTFISSLLPNLHGKSFPCALLPYFPFRIGRYTTPMNPSQGTPSPFSRMHSLPT